MGAPRLSSISEKFHVTIISSHPMEFIEQVTQVSDSRFAFLSKV